MNCLSVNPIKQINFTSRKKEVREADDIQRKAKSTLPVHGHTYPAYYYLSCSPESKNYANTYKYLEKLMYRILYMRNDLESEKYSSYYTSLFASDLDNMELVKKLRTLKTYKIGNCAECGDIALAALFANGYYNSCKGVLKYKVDFVDKEKKEVVHSYSEKMDHTFAITDMNKKDEKKNIVVDPWLGMADTVEGAFARYKKLYQEDDYSGVINNAIFDCKKNGLNPDDYEIRAKFVIEPVDDISTRYQKVIIGDNIRNEFQDFVLDKNKSKFTR